MKENIAKAVIVTLFALIFGAASFGLTKLGVQNADVKSWVCGVAPTP